MIKVDKTHVTVGHESISDSGSVSTRVEAFDICSNVHLQKRGDASGDDYLCTTDDVGNHVGDSTHKWFHVAVTRFQVTHTHTHTHTHTPCTHVQYL